MESVYNPAEEVVLIVDENNNPIGTAPRKEMRKQSMIHRSSCIFIKNSQNLFYVQKRVETKDVYPGYFDPATGGVVVAADLNDKEAAIRELEEELGISGIDIEYVDTFFYTSPSNNVWGSIYLAEWDGPVQLQVEEVASIHMMSIREIIDRFNNGEKFCPDSIFALNKLIETGKISL